MLDSRLPANIRQLNFLLMIATLCTFLYSLSDFALLIPNFWGPGWDLITNCDGAYAYLNGKNPYLADSYQFSKNLFTYPTFFLPLTAGLCRALGIHDLHQVYAYFPAYWLFTALMLYQAAKVAQAKELSPMFYFMSTAALGGLIWCIRTGNFACFEFGFLALALAYMMRSLSPDQKENDWLWFSSLFGMFCSIKSVSLIVVPLFFLLPVTPKRKLQMVAIAGVIGAFPALLDAIAHPDYQTLRFKIIKEDQRLYCNPSMYCMFKTMAADTGLTKVTPALMGVIVSCVAAFSLSVWLLMNGVLGRIKNMTNDTAFEAFILAMFLGEALLPRLKEYTYGHFAVLAAFYLLSRRRLDGFAFSVIAISLLPVLVNQPHLAADNIFGGYVQLMCVWALAAAFLSDFFYGYRCPTKPHYADPAR